MYHLHQELEKECLFSLVITSVHVCFVTKNKHWLKEEIWSGSKKTPPGIQRQLIKEPNRARKVNELTSGLRAQQSLFTKPAAQNKASPQASFHVNHLLAKHKKPFTDGDLSKEAMAITIVFNRLFSTNSKRKTSKLKSLVYC